MSALAATIDALVAVVPPSEGAHRLAWWLCADHRRWGDLIEIFTPGFVDRLLTGAVLPSEDGAMRIARVTCGDVLPMDWDRRTVAGWSDRPVSRETKDRA